MTIFSTQISTGEKIINRFLTSSYVILLAPMQSGKTGTFKFVGFEMLRFLTVSRVVIFSGNRETELKTQTLDPNGKFKKSYIEYLVNQGIKYEEAVDTTNFLEKKVHVYWGGDLKKFVPMSNTLYIWDESHYAQNKEMQPDKFLKRIGIQPTGITSNNSYMLSVSATPFSELSDNYHFEQKKEIVKLIPSANYLSPKRLLQNGQIKMCNNTLNELKKINLEMYGIVRAKGAKHDQVLSIASSRGWNVIKYDQHNKLIKDVNEILLNKPENPTLILIKDKLRMGKQLQKKYVNFVMETTKSRTDVLLQSLLGRCCGYIRGEDFANEDIIIYLVNSDTKHVKFVEEIERYSNLFQSSDVSATIPLRGNNIVVPEHPNYITPILFTMNKNYPDPDREEIRNKAWEVIDANSDANPNNKQYLEIKNRNNRKNFKIRYEFNSENAMNKDELFDYLRDMYNKDRPFHPGSSYGCDKDRLDVWCLDKDKQEYAIVASTETSHHTCVPLTTKDEVFCKTNENDEPGDMFAFTFPIEARNNAIILEDYLTDIISLSKKYNLQKNNISPRDYINVTLEVYNELTTTITNNFKENNIILNYKKVRGRKPNDCPYIRLSEISWTFVK